jgi:mersacidin/lichenicidin family type 2 lantibiotic
MNKVDVIRAWKDEDYRLSLSDEERAMLPAHPAGVIELADAALDQIVGGGPGTYEPTKGPISKVPPDPPPTSKIPDTCNTKTTKPYPKVFLGW